MHTEEKSRFGQNFPNFPQNKIKIHFGVNFLQHTLHLSIRNHVQSMTIFLVHWAMSSYHGNITIYVYVGWITNTEGFNQSSITEILGITISHVFLSSLLILRKVTGPPLRVGGVKSQIVRVQVRHILRSAF